VKGVGDGSRTTWWLAGSCGLLFTRIPPISTVRFREPAVRIEGLVQNWCIIEVDIEIEKKRDIPPMPRDLDEGQSIK
jgi:hypothetical protein